MCAITKKYDKTELIALVTRQSEATAIRHQPFLAAATILNGLKGRPLEDDKKNISQGETFFHFRSSNKYI